MEYNIGTDKVYSDIDLYKTATLLAKVVADGTRERLPSLLEQLTRALMFDRVTIFWGKNFEMLATSNPELYDADVYPQILDNGYYFDMFSDEMLLIRNINLIKGSMPDVYKFLQELGISSTMQHLLRDKNGAIFGLIIADECQENRTFPQIAVQTFSFICKIINSVLLNTEAS